MTPKSHTNSCFGPMQTTSKTMLGSSLIPAHRAAPWIFANLDKQKRRLRLKRKRSRTKALKASARIHRATQTGSAQQKTILTTNPPDHLQVTGVLRAWEPWVDGTNAHRRIRRTASLTSWCLGPVRNRASSVITARAMRRTPSMTRICKQQIRAGNVWRGQCGGEFRKKI